MTEPPDERGWRPDTPQAMPPMPPQPVQPFSYADPTQVSRDDEHLRLLAIFHYIVGGLIALFSSCGIFYLVIGAVAFTNPAALQGTQPMPGYMPWFLSILGGGMVALGWAIGGLTIYSGRCMAKRRARTFSLIMAGVICIWVPFGTVLGVFTFIVLLRPSVAAMYPRR